MSRWTVAPTQDRLLKDGKPFFYLADTAWMAFANLPLADWPRYLAHRKLQGFTALQISILPVTHDTSMSPDNLDPFHKDAHGNWDFTQYNEEYFAKAEQMIEMAVAADFAPVLGVLWCSYAPETRCSNNSPVASAMPLDAVAPYATYAAERFKRFDPMFFISGDTQFESPHEETYYMTALQAVRAVCPDALLTMHLTPRGELSRAFVDAIDFYMFQSGHRAGAQDMPYVLAEKFAAYPVKRPVINAEPPYEGHGRVGEKTRFNAFDVRKATWQSLLSGAKAGVTYGAHGIWMFHRPGMKFLNIRNAFEPFPWEAALTMDGAWDVGFARWLYETYGFFDLEPARLLLNDDPEIRAAATADRRTVAIYSPYAFDLDLDLDLSGYKVQLIELATRRVAVPVVEAGTPSRIRMHPFNADVLLIARQE